jgi:hypothetical protein
MERKGKEREEREGKKSGWGYSPLKLVTLSTPLILAHMPAGVQSNALAIVTYVTYVVVGRGGIAFGCEMLYLENRIEARWEFR